MIIESNKKIPFKKSMVPHTDGCYFFFTFPGLQTVKLEQLSSGSQSFYQQQSN